MYPHAIARLWRTRRRCVATLMTATAASLLSLTVAPLGAQIRPDSVKAAAKADSVRSIEGVLVRAIRANDQAPISQSTISRAAITQRGSRTIRRRNVDTLRY